jgi:hypothetical protein
MKRTIVFMTVTVVCLSAIVIAPASAQSPTPSWQDGVSQHHRMMYQLMNDMTQEMDHMRKQMSQGVPTPAQTKQMARRMRIMSTMMRRMSEPAARPSMKGVAWEKQMNLMRKQMNEMMGNPSMTPIAR